MYCTNNNFNVMALTDANGAVVERVKYDPYGQPICTRTSDSDVTTASHFANPWLFQGQRFCSETGIYYFKNRDQRPDLGRFLQRDPLGYVDGMNLYETVISNPLCAVDPAGTDVEVHLTEAWGSGGIGTHAAISIRFDDGRIFNYETVPYLFGLLLLKPWARVEKSTGEYRPEDLKKKTFKVVEGHDKDEEYKDICEAEVKGRGFDWDPVKNNCVHWVCGVIKQAGDEWPVTYDLNRGLNKGNPRYRPPTPSCGKALIKSQDEARKKFVEELMSKNLTPGEFRSEIEKFTREHPVILD